ncbi:type IV toxin-antitoxin system AbiEi family antitoxin domain-containing protein [uncultured Slackia sp.]|uniref:type IV toxin-antitoxin system AbiEi family antitoxin domain-containing protein n=1 Tax=uncultured Slackia sp. TaxID=665903 RepID=UPI002805D805|nr:type IV toxin-antitoxin system AbiEi family antitoxin domain-containing protein [uncultured Slackia sp.]
MEASMDIATNHNGYITSAQATAAGIPRRKLTEAVRGELVQVDRGLYAPPSAWEDPFCIAQHRFSRGIFSDDTALFLHGMTNRAPFSPTMTFPRSYNATTTKAAGSHAAPAPTTSQASTSAISFAAMARLKSS